MASQIRYLLETQGLLGAVVFIIQKIFFRQFPLYGDHLHLFKDKAGIEIGGPSAVFRKGGYLPLYNDVAKLDNCNFSDSTLWEGEIAKGETFVFDKKKPAGTQYIVDATELNMIADKQYQFVLSSHTIEHTANPIKALMEWKRIITDSGTLLLIVPHFEGTFDHKREVTHLDHIVEDFRLGTDESDTTHFKDVRENHDHKRDYHQSTNTDIFEEMVTNNINTRIVHHHVFDTALVFHLVSLVGFEVLHISAYRPHNILVIARKSDSGRNLNLDDLETDKLRKNYVASLRKSSFRSDSLKLTKMKYE